MKKVISLLLIFLTLLSSYGVAQVENHEGHPHKVLNDKKALEKFNYEKFENELASIISKKGYDYHFDACIKNFYLSKQSNLFYEIFNAYKEDKSSNEYAEIYKKHLNLYVDYFQLFIENESLLRAEYKRRYESAKPSLLKSSTPNATQSVCTNMDFEEGTLNGWTSSESSSGVGSTYVTTVGTDPNVNTIQMVYTGTNSACIDVLGGGNNLDWEQMKQTFLVTNANKNFVFYTAVIFNSGGHTCNQNPKFEVTVKDASNNVIPCSAINLTSYDTNGNPCTPYTGFSKVTIGGFIPVSYDVLDWTPIIVPLGAYVGQNVTISYRVTRCNGGGGHGARAYLEAACSPVDLTVNGNLICPGKSVSLVAPNVVGYNFNWSGPSGFSASTYSIHPSLAGVYTVTMSLVSNPTCKMSMDTMIISVPSPTANFNYTVTPCAPTNSVPVVSSSIAAPSDPIASYTWLWGDATANGTGTSTNHTYASTGVKSVELLVVSNYGCRDSITQSFTFSPGPIASFNTIGGCLGTITNFTSTSTAALGITSQTWNFNDGSPFGSGTTPSHTYTNPGTYTPTLTVTATGGCTAIATQSVVIYPKPTITFTANPVCLNSITNFTNNSTITSPSSISNWAWDYNNDGAIDNTTQIGSNTYSTTGTFIAVLTATSSYGCVNTGSVMVAVNPNPTAAFTPVNACINANVLLNNASTIPSPDNISSYNWVFDSGSTPTSSSNQNPPSLTFNSSGVKTITLTITSNNSCTATVTNTVIIYPSPVANFSATSVCQSTATAFTDMSTISSGTINAWSWDYTNDGSSDNSTQNPTFTYPISGTFTAALTVSTSVGCANTYTVPIDVWGHAIPNFSVTTACLNVTNNFTNLTNTTTNANVGGTPTWSWDFSDTSPLSSLQNPTHTYTSTGTFSVVLTATTTNGCIDNITKPAIVNVLPTASFSPVNACLNSNVLLNNTSTIPLPDNINQYNWSFGPNSSPNSSSNQNPPSLTYNTSGVKTITLNITSNTTCTASITQTVEIYPQPIANFSTTSVCQSTATAYSDLSTTAAGSITGWDWDFTNNGSIDNSTQNPTNVYASSGTFSTSLIVTTSNGCKDTVILPVDVWGHAIPDFSLSNVCLGTATTFTNTTNITTNPNVGTTPSYSWDFADGSGVQVLAGNPSHTYLGTNVNATYIVTLTATSSHNCIDTVSKIAHVYAIPTASFTSDSICLGSPSHMVDASNGNGNTINGYIWDFLSNGTIDATGVSNPNFTFPAYGNNAVTYTASTSPVVGLTCQNITSTITVWVNPNPIPNFTFVNKCINAQPNSYDASSSTIAVGTNTAYTWAFGDGVTSPSNITPTHTFVTAGIYNTTLTITSNKGCQTKVTKQVEVYQKPLMSITASSACFKSAMTFTAVSLAGSGTVNSWSWDFNNTIASYEGYGEFPSFNFPTAGSQTVHLVASTTHGCIDTFTSQVYVDYLPQPAFTVDKPSGCPLHCVKFTDNTPALTPPGVNNSWQWVFGDGATITSSTSASQSHCYDNTSYSQSALFDVKLIVTSDKGCKDSLNKPAFITVYPTPVAQYTVDPNPGSIVSPIEQFTNQSLGFTKVWWCFGDGPISDTTNINPLHFYNDINAADYYSYLIVANQYGCKDTFNVKVEIAPEFIFYIPNAFTPDNGDGINDFFTGMGVGITTYEMWIFDRWGVNIFYSDDIYKGWNGKVQGKEALVQQDVYIWKVKLTDVLGKKHDYVGHVTVLR